MMKTITTAFLLLIASSFLNPAFAATPKIGQVTVSCPAGPCWVVAGVAVKHPGSGIEDHYTVSAGRTISFNVIACDTIRMYGEMTVDRQNFFVAPCNDKYTKYRRSPIHLGDTIKVTGSSGMVKFEVVAG